jgi:predicted phage terminase large subunit-like protein
MIYLLDVWRKKVDYPELKRAAIALAQRFQPGKILVEEKSSGIQLIQELAQIRMEVTSCTPSGDKQKRLLLNTAPIETGRMRIPQQAPWLKDYIGELITFPRGQYADQVDSTTQALEWIKNTPPEPAIFPIMREQLEKQGIKVKR